MPRGLSSRVCPAGSEAALLEPWKWGHVLGMAGASASPHARCRAQAPFHKGETAGPNSSPHDQARSTPSLPPWGPALSQGSDVRRPPLSPPCSPRSPLSILPGASPSTQTLCREHSFPDGTSKFWGDSHQKTGTGRRGRLGQPGSCARPGAGQWGQHPLRSRMEHGRSWLSKGGEGGGYWVQVCAPQIRVLRPGPKCDGRQVGPGARDEVVRVGRD